jgi:hypothetical protein
VYFDRTKLNSLGRTMVLARIPGGLGPGRAFCCRPLIHTTTPITPR